MKPLSANMAAKVAHKTKKSILDAIEKGDLSAAKNARGHWEIDPSELNRVFSYKIEELDKNQSSKPVNTDEENRLKIVELEAEVKALRDKIETASLEREREREQLSQHIETLKGALLLEDKRHVQSARRFFGLFPRTSA